MGGHTESPCTPRCSSCSTSLCPALCWDRAAWLPISSCPGRGCPWLIVSEARGSQALGSPHNFPAGVCACSQLGGEEQPGQLPSSFHLGTPREPQPAGPRARFTRTAGSPHSRTAAAGPAQSQHGKLCNPQPFVAQGPAGIPALEQ